ncbi:MAG: hypothetical protein M1831_004889 [Alyxoria varia]|nr:MAG: hypothetical protein M1831_004889 [Alyxoria varia]
MISMQSFKNDIFFDAQFYPYTKPGEDPVFAVVTYRGDTVVCRPCALRSDEKCDDDDDNDDDDEKDDIEILRLFRDQDPDCTLNSVCWSQDTKTGDPLLCVAGQKPIIKVLNVTTGKLVKTLIGHGKAINDLDVCPTAPWLLISGAEDNSIRLWDLRSEWEKQPCAALFAGDGGHTSGILTTKFHATGRYFLSGGFDTAIKMWAVPDDLPDGNKGMEEPPIVHYPYFSSVEIHSENVDSVCFFGDLILSKCAEEHRILLWRVEGFSTLDRVPNPATSLPATKTASSETRSAFGPGWQQLVVFDLPGSEGYFIRFGLFNMPFKHPILACGGDLTDEVSFWDLEKLAHGAVEDIGKASKPIVSTKKGVTGERTPSATAWLGVSSKSSASQKTDDAEPELPGPFSAVEPHGSAILSEAGAYKCAWSRGGEWLVVAGARRVDLLSRWMDD